ncbi:hypothetical protein [Streptomyces sp. CoH27]|nr:hypothetical protein [Streptomyces sp. CoH27]
MRTTGRHRPVGMCARGGGPDAALGDLLDEQLTQLALGLAW